MTKFAEMQSAMRTKEVITSIAKSVIASERPEERIGRVFSVDQHNGIAQILFPGDSVDNTVSVRFAQDKVPTRWMLQTFNDDGYDAIGDIVRVAGKPGAYYILDYVDGLPAVDPATRSVITQNTEPINASLENLNVVVLPGLQSELDTANQDLANLNTVIIPGLQSTLGDAENAITQLNTVTIPNLNNQLDQAQQELNTLNTTTLPALQQDLTDAQTDINTLNNTTIPGINSTLGTLQTDLSDANTAIVQRTRTIIQTAQPTGLGANDRVIWLDSDNGYKSSYWNGSTWAAYQLSGAAILPGGIVTSHMTANEISGDRITADTLAASKIVANSISAGQIATGAITADEIASNAVTAVKILAGAVTTVKMTADTINGDRITTNTLNAAKIVAGSITTDRMTANTILGDRIEAGTLAANKIVANSLTAGQIATGAIAADEIASNAVTAVKILAGAVTTDKMTANTINGDRIQANTLHADKITANTITSGKIAAGAITAEKLSVRAGGNNLIDNSDATATTPLLANNGPATITRDTAFKMPGKLASFKATVTATSSFTGWGVRLLSDVNVASNTVGIRPNTTYTATTTVWIPSDSGITNVSLVASGNGQAASPGFMSSPTYTDKAKWIDVSVTFTTNATGTVTVGHWTTPTTHTVGKFYYIGQVTLHEGDVPQAWAPKQKELLPGTIVADHIAADALTGKTFRTAASGRRIEITTGATHNIDFYNTPGARAAYVEVDEASAYDFKIQSGSGMIINTTGRGLTHTGGQATFNGGAYGYYVTAGPGGLGVLGSADIDGSLEVNGNVVFTNLGIFMGLTTVSAPANMYISTGNQLARISSTRRTKKNIVELPHDPKQLLSLRPVEFNGMNELDDADKRYTGFIAEEADEAGLGQWVEYDSDGRPSGFHYGAWPAALQKIVRYQEDRIDKLVEQINELREMVGT